MDRETVGRVREQSALWEDDELVALCDALLEAWDENDRKDDLIAYSASMSLRIADGVEKLPAVIDAWEARVRVLEDALRALTDWVHQGPFRPGVHYATQLDEQVEIARAVLSGEVG